MANPTFNELIVLIQDRMRNSRLKSECGLTMQKAFFEPVNKELFPNSSYLWIGTWTNAHTKRRITCYFYDQGHGPILSVTNLSLNPEKDHFLISSFCSGEKIPIINDESMKIPDPKDQINFIFNSIEKLLDGRLGSILLGKEWVDYPIDYGGYK